MIPRPEMWRQKVERFRQDGLERLCVVSDWDRTLTPARTPDGRVLTTYAIIAHEAGLGEDYVRASQALYETYRQVEVSAEMSAVEKRGQMQTWWEEEFALLVRYGFGKKHLEQLITGEMLRLREGGEAFLHLLAQTGVPLTIVSAGIRDVIEGFLEHQNLLFDNVHIIANRLRFDASGHMVGHLEPVIHSLNKQEKWMGGQKAMVQDRRNVILLGDTLEDAQMVDERHTAGIIRCGLFDAEVEQLRDLYAAVYDVLICGDGPLTFWCDWLEDLI